jgi:hypothetical protein
MDNSTKQILSLIEQYLNEYPNHRFTQALFNLKIIEFGGTTDKPGGSSYLLRDCYYDGNAMVLKRMEGQFKPRYKVDCILIVMAAENNEEAKFLFSKPELKLAELEEYPWLLKAFVTDEATIAFLNKLVNHKKAALLHHDYELAGNDRHDELETIRKAAELNGMTDFIIDAHRDFETVRCYLLLKSIQKNDLHEGFEKKV